VKQCFFFTNFNHLLMWICFIYNLVWTKWKHLIRFFGNVWQCCAFLLKNTSLHTVNSFVTVCCLTNSEPPIQINASLLFFNIRKQLSCCCFVSEIQRKNRSLWFDQVALSLWHNKLCHKKLTVSTLFVEKLVLYCYVKV